jgi:alpha-tubulin suppressor-like RCC1 family protein
MLESCDSGGHLTTVTCDAVAACDPVAGACRDFATLPRLSLAIGVGCAVEDNRTVRCWGNDYYGNLFIGDPLPAEPTAVPINSASGARQVSVADDHGCYLVDSGEVMCWGRSLEDQLGILGMASNPSPPVAVWAVGTALTGALEVAVLHGCSCARMVDGTVKCWGYQGNGCFGDASTATTSQQYPTAVAGISKAVQIRAGADGSVLCVRKVDGTVACWTPSIAVSQVPGVTDATDVEPGNGLVFIQSKSQGLLSVAPKADNTGWMAPTPYTSAGSIGIMAAGDAFCGLQAGTAVVCGLLPSSSPPVPLPVQGQPSGTVVELAAGGAIGAVTGLQCLRLAGPLSGNVYCWGDDNGYALGDGAPEVYRNFAQATGVVGATAISTGQNVSYAVVAAGEIKFWGRYEGLGNNFNPAPTLATSLGTGYAGIWTHDTSNTGYLLETNGTAVFLSYATPMPGMNLASMGYADFVDVRTWSSFDIGLRAGGTIVLYARDATANAAGVFGDGTQAVQAGTLETVQPITNAVAVASSSNDYGADPAHVCAILGPSGSVSCWGSNRSGQIGNGTSGNYVTSPSAVTLPSGETAVSIAVSVTHAEGQGFSCAATASGKVYCWGDNTVGELGSAGADSTTPVQVPGITSALGVTARSGFACAWLVDKTVWCWGENYAGQLGNGALSASSPPGPVAGLTTVVEVSAGSTHACALRTDMSVACWGSSYFGQVGDGLTGIAPQPQLVLGL